MDPEEAEAVTGQILSEIFEVEDGWAHYSANFANEEGECSKAQFQSMVEAILDKHLDKIKKQMYKPIRKAYKMAGGTGDDQCNKVVDRVVKKFPTFVPIFTNALFRFFDEDGSGTISKDEIILAIGGSLGESGPNMALLVPAIFRTLDTDNSGAIEPVEVQPFITEIITAFAKLVSALIEELENDFKGGMKKKVLKKAAKVIDGIVENEGIPFPVPVDTLIDMVKECPMFDRDGLAEMIHESATIKAMSDPARPMFESFFAKFEEASEGKPLPLRKAAGVMASTFLSPVTAMLDADLVGQMLPGLVEQMDMDLPFDIADLDLGDLLNVGTGVMSSYLKSGGMKRFFEAFLAFLDVNNDGDISMKELRGLYDCVCGVVDSTDPDAAMEAICALSRCVFQIFDSDGSGTFDLDDLPKLYDKSVELVVSLTLMYVELVKSVCLAITMPALNLGFAMFTADGSIDIGMINELVGGDEE